ncbi:MAG: hypothetical protein WC891_07800 [Actinomycetota bacterium]
MKINKVKLTVAASAVVLFSVFFYTGYQFGLKQAETTFPEPEEVWAKEESARIDVGISPDVVRLPDASWRMYYAVEEGIVSAISQDGLKWSKEEGVRINPNKKSKDQRLVDNPAIIKLKEGGYRMLYEGSDATQKNFAIFSAVSTDGSTWKKEKGVRLQDTNRFDQKIAATPDVVKPRGSSWYMYYSDGDTIKLAVSDDEGESWRKRTLSGLPNACLDPSVIVMSDGVFRMYFVKSESEEKLTGAVIISARSTNGYDWEVEKGARVSADKGAIMVLDPDVVLVSLGKMRMYYTQLDKGLLTGKGANAPKLSIRSANLELR